MYNHVDLALRYVLIWVWVGRHGHEDQTSRHPRVSIGRR